MHQDPASPRRRAARQLPPRRSFFARYWILFLFLVVLGAAGGVGYYFFYGSVASAEVALVARGTALAGVYGTVDIEPVNQVIVRTNNFGLLSKINVKEGDEVKIGEVLAEVTDANLQGQLQTAQSELADGIVRQSLGPPSEAALKNQQIQVDKLKKLLDADNIAASEYQMAVNQLTQLLAQVQNEKMSQTNEVSSLTRTRDGIQGQLNGMKLTSPMDGTVLNLYANLGEDLPPQTQFCRIGSAEDQVVANVNEEDVGYLRTGMKGQIRLYADPNENLVGTLTKILPQAENQVYRVRFKLDNPPQMLLPGMTGEMNVIIGEHADALTIPSRALRKDGTVLALIHGRVEEVKVSVGFHTLERTEILGGLDEGTPVILSNQDLYKPGTRVRALVVKSS